MPDYRVEGVGISELVLTEECVTTRGSGVLFLPVVNGAFRPDTKVWPRPVLTCCS